MLHLNVAKEKNSASKSKGPPNINLQTTPHKTAKKINTMSQSTRVGSMSGLK